MELEVDNKGAVDLTHNWSVGGRTRHVDVRQYFLRELKEEGVIVVKWISTDKNCTDLYTKNLAGPLFERHTEKFCGKDIYMKSGDDKVMANNSQREGVTSEYEGNPEKGPNAKDG